MGVPNRNQTREKIGIIGLGSIGNRHINSLSRLAEIEVVAYRTGKGNKRLDPSIAPLVKEVNSIEALAEVDRIIISNPTSLHHETIMKVLPLNKQLFIEKPITDSLENLMKLMKHLENYQPKVQIGFCLRYLNVIRLVKDKIEEGVLGEVYHARLSVGQYLPMWHPYTDYRTEYFSKKELGGGAIRTLSHEIDLAQFFFGKPQAVNAMVSKISDLEIDVDDYSILFLKYPQKLVKLEIDFLQRSPKRTGLICGTKADLEYDAFKSLLNLCDKEGKQIESIEVPKGDMYESQMADFLDGREGDKFATVEESRILMEIISKAEESSDNKKWNTI